MSRFSTDKVVKLQGKEYVLFEGLLEVAHAHCNLKSISTNLIQLPTQESPFCIVQATVTTENGESFQGIGDASPANVNKMIVPHLIRMAETRAVARALRFLTGFGTAFEELGDMHEQSHETNRKPAQSATASTPAQSQVLKKNYVQAAVEQLKAHDEQQALVDAMQGTPIQVSEEEIKELFGDDVTIAYEDDPVTTIDEAELKRIRAKISATKPKEAKDYGTIYKWITPAAGITIKSKDDLPKIPQSNFKAVCAALDAKAGHFDLAG
jgi:hypothetical protein